jgi:hypothetical protein
MIRAGLNAKFAALTAGVAASAIQYDALQQARPVLRVKGAGLLRVNTYRSARARQVPSTAHAPSAPSVVAKLSGDGDRRSYAHEGCLADGVQLKKAVAVGSIGPGPLT